MTRFIFFIVGLIAGYVLALVLFKKRHPVDRKLQGSYLSFFIHEVNSPLTALNMAVQNLLSGLFGPVSADQRKWVESMHDQLSRTRDLIEDFRDLVHLELLDDFRQEHDQEFPKKVLESALAIQQRAFKQAAIEIQIVIQNDLPMLHTDIERFTRAASDILYHARKFRLSGPVLIEFKQQHNNLLFQVSYTGQVMTIKEVESSMQLYYPGYKRVDQKLRSTGLGLGLTKSIVQKIGCDMKFYVDSNGYTQISLITPVKDHING